MKRITLKLLAPMGLTMLCLNCGTKQPVAPRELPKPVLPQARTCPGALVGENLQISTAIGESNSPVIIWSKSAFSLSWWDLRGRYPTVYYKRIDRSGVPRSPVIKLPNKGASRDQSLAFDGRQITVAWSDRGSIVFTSLPGGEDTATMLAQTGVTPAAGPFGAVAWVDKGKLFFRSDGMLVPTNDNVSPKEPEPVTVATGGIETPSLVYNGEFYAIVWSSSVTGGREILMQRVSPRGIKLGPQVKVSAAAGISRKPVIAWAGGDFAIAWTNAAPAQTGVSDRFKLFFAVVPQAGDAPSLTRQLDFQGSADQVALAATGKEYALAWLGSKNTRGSAVYLQRIGLDATPLDETMEVTDGVPLACGRPSLAWDGDGYGVTWHDDRAPTGSEVFFAYVECGEEISKPVPPPTEAKAGVDAGAEETDSRDSDTQPETKPPALKEAF